MSDPGRQGSIATAFATREGGEAERGPAEGRAVCYHRGMGEKDKPQSQSPPPLPPKPGPSGLPPAPPRIGVKGL